MSHIHHIFYKYTVLALFIEMMLACGLKNCCQDRHNLLQRRLSVHQESDRQESSKFTVLKTLVPEWLWYRATFHIFSSRILNFTGY